MNIALTDFSLQNNLQPLSSIRHVAEIRVGVFTIREKWEMLLNAPVTLTSEESLPGHITIPANLLPCLEDYLQIIEAFKTHTPLPAEFRRIVYPWDILQHNAWAIGMDVYAIMNLRKSVKADSSNYILNEKAVFIEEGAKIKHCSINAEAGPVYIGKDAEVMEGTLIRGPVAICNSAIVKMGAKLYGGSTIGPYCIAGGEIKNSILSGWSNKAHDGYLGDSVIGEWCNIGAGSSNSNLKNSAGDVIYDLPHLSGPVNAGKKAGLIMGDYSRAAINTSFNTGTIIGVCCNIFDQDLLPRYVPHFSWGTNKYEFEKALKDISNWKALKGQSLSENESALLQKLYYKTFENA